MNILSQEVKDLRRLVIKAFHIKSIEEGLENSVSSDGKMKVCTEVVKIKEEKSAIDKIEISVIKPKEHNRWTNSIMDIVPISTKVLETGGRNYPYIDRRICDFDRSRCEWRYRRRSSAHLKGFWRINYIWEVRAPTRILPDFL